MSMSVDVSVGVGVGVDFDGDGDDDDDGDGDGDNSLSPPGHIATGALISVGQTIDGKPPARSPYQL